MLGRLPSAPCTTDPRSRNFPIRSDGPDRPPDRSRRARRGGRRQRPGRRPGLGHRRGPGRPWIWSRGPWSWSTTTGRRPSTPPWGRPPRRRADRRPTPRPAWPPWAAGPPSSAGWPTTSSGQAFTHDIRSIGVAFDPTPDAGRARRGGDRPLPGAGHRRRRADHGHPPRGGVRLRRRSTCTTATSPRPRSSTSRATCGSSRRPRRPCARPSRWPTRSDAAGGPHRVGPVLRRAPPGRVPRAAERRPRDALRQRGGGHARCSGRPTSTPPWTRWPRPACWPC